MDLHRDVQTCGYDDVQVMWNMLSSEKHALGHRPAAPEKPPRRRATFWRASFCKMLDGAGKNGSGASRLLASAVCIAFPALLWNESKAADCGLIRVTMLQISSSDLVCLWHVISIQSPVLMSK